MMESNEQDLDLRQTLCVGVAYFCIFASGAAGLIYEVLWAKYLALYVGSTALAQVIVLATFMGGLALGSHLLGGLADRVKNPLKLYAYLEFGIGGREPCLIHIRGDILTERDVVDYTISV